MDISSASHSLVEPGTRHVLETALRQCHETRNIYYTQVAHVVLILIFVGVVWILLFTSPKTIPMTEKQDIHRREVMSKIAAAQAQLEHLDTPPNDGVLSGLPNW